jgi:hypothetical protein
VLVLCLQISIQPQKQNKLYQKRQRNYSVVTYPVGSHFL